MKLSKIIAAACLSMAPLAAASATTYDAFSSFDGTQGAGNFHYGSNGTPFGFNAPCVLGLTCLETAAASDGAAVYKNTGASFVIEGSHVLNDQLLIVPDKFGVGSSFKAPHAGIYSVFAAFQALDDDPTGVTIVQFKVLSGVLSTNVLLGNGIPNNLLFGAADIALGAGDSYGFAIAPGRSPENDLTGLKFTVTEAVPEPAAWAMMIAGFGLSGAALRRKAVKGSRKPTLA